MTDTKIVEQNAFASIVFYSGVSRMTSKTTS